MITIKKAIEILTCCYSGYFDINRINYTDAIKLGIKALERFRNLRDAGKDVGMPYLKGETKDKW